MADLYGSQDVTIRNDDGSKIVTVITDGLKERLATSASITDNVATVSAVNTIGNIAAGVTTTCAFEDITNQSAIQFIALYDQPITIYIDQSIDGITAVVTDTFYGIASVGVASSVVSVAPYYRIRVTNQNASTQATGSIVTAKTALFNVLPRSLDTNGHLRVSTPVDRYGNAAEVSPMGDMRSVTPVRLVGTSFEGTTIDSNFWTTAASGTGASISQSGADLDMVTGTASGATVTAYTVRRARYVGGYAMRYRTVLQVGTGQTNNTRRWGIGYGTSMPTVTDGAFFKLSGTTFSISTVVGGVETNVTSFNGSLGSAYAPGTTVKTYEIYWTNSKVVFVVGDTILHTVSASTATWANTMSPHVFMDSVNSAAATSSTMSIRTSTIHRLGLLETETNYKNIVGAATTTCKYGPGKLHILTNNAGVGTTTIYDNTAGSGTKIATITMGNNLNYPFMCPFFVGLTIVTTGTGNDITVVYE